jgi:hypothetical protein
MEARILTLPSATHAAPSVVALYGDRIIVERLELVDGALAASLADRPEDDRAAVVARALRIGLLAIQDAAVSMDADVVRQEFDALLRRQEAANERAAQALETTLRANFADGEGRLPRTLETFLGDRGSLRRFVGELFDETKRDSAIGRMGALLGQYFDGDASRLARLLDPTRLGSPLHQFRTEIADGFRGVHERLTALEAASRARAEERARGTAKGADFEELLDELLGGIARGSGDLLDRTANEEGAVLRSKKGDFVLTIDPTLARGADLRVVVEAKDRPMSLRAIRDELREARQNRCAAIALAVFTTSHAPAGVAPFTVLGDDVYAVVDPADPDAPTLEAAVKLARLLALATLGEREVDVDAAGIAQALAGIREQLDAIQKFKTQLTSIGNATKAVWSGLDGLRAAIIAKVAEAEAGLRIER